MVVIDKQRSHVVSDVVRDADEQRDNPSRTPRRAWVAPAWERRDTPMEVTMYAGQR